MKKIILVILSMLILTGCNGSNTSAPVTRDDQNIVPNILSLSNTVDYGNYFYIVDKNTHVVYLSYDGHKRAGITVLLKADGSPMLAEDLGIKVD